MVNIRKTKLYKEGMKAEIKRRRKMTPREKRLEDRLAGATWKLQHLKTKSGSWSVSSKKRVIRRAKAAKAIKRKTIRGK